MELECQVVNVSVNGRGVGSVGCHTLTSSVLKKWMNVHERSFQDSIKRIKSENLRFFVQLFHKINSNTLTLYKHFWPWGASSSGLVSQSSLSQAFIWSTIIVWVFIQSTETVLKWIDVKIWMEKKCSRTFLLPFDCAFSVKQIFGDSRIGQDQKNGEHYQTLHIFCKWLSLNFSLDFL